MPKGKATGPDHMPAEMYDELPGFRETLAHLYSQMIETNYIPLEASRYYVLPFDKAGENPTL